MVNGWACVIKQSAYDMGYFANESIMQGFQQTEDGYEENGGYAPRSPEKYNKRCKHCGTEGLRWLSVDSRWRLAARDGQLHVCTVHKFKE